MSHFLHALANTHSNGPLILDGSMGAFLQTKNLTPEDFGGMDGFNEILVQTRPDVITDLHLEFLTAGVDILETDSFGGAPWVLDEYEHGHMTEELNQRSAELARDAISQFLRNTGTVEATAASRDGSLGDAAAIADTAAGHDTVSVNTAGAAAGKRNLLAPTKFVAGSIGPGTKSPTLSLLKDPSAGDYISSAQMIAGYTRQARGLIAGGVDLLLVETVFDLLQAKAAIIACHEANRLENTSIPIAVSVTIEQGINTMLLGSEISAAVATLDPLGVDVMGLNCATGPEDMREHVAYLSKHSRLPIMVVPNAGIPENINGTTCYPLSHEGLAVAHKSFVQDFGVQIVGGCCGTTPDHLAATVKAVKGLPVPKREVLWEPGVSSLYQQVPWEQENSFHIIGERLNANGSKAFREHMLAGNMPEMLNIARTQTSEGANALDVCVDYVGRDGVPDMKNLVGNLATNSTLPLVIDSTEPGVIEAALEMVPGRPTINSCNLEDGRNKADIILGLAKKWGAAVVCLAIDEKGQARTVEDKVSICERIAKIAIDEFGLLAEDLVFDTLVFPLGSGQEDLRKDALATLEAIEAIKQRVPGCKTTLGLSNVSFGLSPAARQALNSVFLAECLERGLDSAIVHASKIMPIGSMDPTTVEVCQDLIYDRRGTAGKQGKASEDYDPLHELMSIFEGVKLVDTQANLTEIALPERLSQRIIDGQQQGLEEDLLATMELGIEPLDIINTHLLAGMKVVGERFGSGQMQLPFVLKSAETMKAAVAMLEPHMSAEDQDGKKASIVLATVKGDVHDIGKNLVDIILTNNGFEVHNIGIKQPIDAILAAAKETNADAIGLSGLLVKSTVIMREDLLTMMNKDMGHVPVLLGGAALNRTFVESDLRALYDGPLFYCKDAFAGLNVMNELADLRSSGNAEGYPADWGTEVAVPKVSARQADAERPDTAEVVASTVDPAKHIPIPPFWGTQVAKGIQLDTILPYLNKRSLFRSQWGFGKGQEDTAEQVLRDVLARVRTETLLVPQAVHGYFPVAAEGNDLLIWRTPEEQDARQEPAYRLNFPRQTANRRLCIPDFFVPWEDGNYLDRFAAGEFTNATGQVAQRDAIALQLVTMGSNVSARAGELFKEDAYTDYLYLHGIGVEMAEALAELWHARVRAELGINQDDSSDMNEIFRQGYQGSRYSFGYAACPNLEDRAMMVEILDAGRVGVELSDSFQLAPEQSTDAFVVHHEVAKYFNAR